MGIWTNCCKEKTPGQSVDVLKSPNLKLLQQGVSVEMDYTISKNVYLYCYIQRVAIC